MEFEWDENKSHSNKIKHGIDFDTAKYLWNDSNRVEIEAPYPLEHRSILIAMIEKNSGRQSLPSAAMRYESFL